ncbi:MAG: gluconokinase [Terrimonas sp.]|nr:gluconokinase [Terrimonas sp.]
MKPIIYIMGVSGCGKTTIGNLLSSQTGIPFFDGDDFHPAANKAKMEKGIPLNDQDRAGWLEAIHEKAVEESQKSGAIIACSALKEKYRDSLSANMEHAVHWVFLRGDFATIYDRMKQRKDHFMPASLLRSQYDILEEPDNALFEDISQPAEAIVADILKKLKLSA